MNRAEKSQPAIARWAVAWFALLITLTVWVRVADPTGWLGSDDAAYYVGAEHILAGEKIERCHHHNARLAMIVPVAAAVAVLGDSPASVALPTLMASVVCVVMVVILGRLLWGWWEGLCAASVVSVLPYFRVLSTTAYPDVHSCLWSTLALVLAILAIRRERIASTVMLGAASGLVLGLAASVKIFSVLALIAIVWTVSAHPVRLHRDRLIVLSSATVGGFLYVILDGLFYSWAAGDFWFKLHALQATSATDGLFPPEPYTLGGYATLAWTRLGLLFHTSTSGWGRVGVMFWPLLLGILLFNSRARPLAVWGMAVYLVVAIVPLNFRNGPQPYPVFEGRHILSACIPFSLCLAWLVRRLAANAFRPVWVERGWPLVMLAVVAAAFVGRRELAGIRDRPTSRVGVAISRLIALTEFDRRREIFMPPSLYLRHRILFPPDLRSRLRVAVAHDAPSWWRTSSVDIVSRCKLLPPPTEAYLIATPTQLNGGLEPWDYGVRLPPDALAEYRSSTPEVCIKRFEDKTIGPAESVSSAGQPLLLLVSQRAARPQLSRWTRYGAATSRSGHFTGLPKSVEHAGTGRNPAGSPVPGASGGISSPERVSVSASSPIFGKVASALVALAVIPAVLHVAWCGRDWSRSVRRRFPDLLKQSGRPSHCASVRKLPGDNRPLL